MTGLSGDVGSDFDERLIDTLVGKATTDTLTNKTLTNLKINEDVRSQRQRHN